MTAIAAIKRRLDKSIITRLVSYNSFIILLVFITAFIFICYITYNLSFNKEIQMMNAYLINSINTVDNQLKDMARVSLVAYSDERTQEIMRNWNTQSELQKMENDSYLKKLFINMITIRDDIDGIYIFDNHSLIFKHDSSGSSVRQDFNLRDAPWLIADDDDSKTVMSGYRLLVNDEYDFIRRAYSIDPFDKYSVYLLRDVKSFSPNERIGYILLLSPISELKETLERSLDPESLYLLLDEDKNIICERTGDNLGKNIVEIDANFAQMLETQHSSFRYGFNKDNRLFNKKRNLVSYHVSEYSGLTLVTFKPLAAVYRSTIAVLVLISVISLCAVVVTIVLTCLSTQKMVRPIQRLSMSMTNFQIGTEIKLPSSTGDEIGRLIDSFNEMIETINDLISSKYETTIKLQAAELKEHQAQLMYLRTQVNPHFLNNTLDTIRFKAELNGDAVVAEMLMQLVDFFRLSINEDRQFVPLENEVKLAQSYLKLMKYRYPNYECEFEVEPDLNRITMPNFILQPLIENSLLHGLKSVNYKGKISITVKRDALEEHDIIIEISDNGLGSPNDIQEYLDTISGESDVPDVEKKVEQPERESKHIGIKNVQERIGLFYPAGYGLSYRGNENRGVTAVIRIRDAVNSVIIITPVRSGRTGGTCNDSRF